MDQGQAILKRECIIAVLFGTIAFAGLAAMPAHQPPEPSAKHAEQEQVDPVLEPVPEPAQLADRNPG